MSTVPHTVAVRRAINLLVGHEKALIEAAASQPEQPIAVPDASAMSVAELCLTMSSIIACGREAGLSVNAMLALLYIHSHGRATTADLRKAGIMRDNASHMATIFRRGSFNVADVLDSVHSGERAVGRYFTLNAIGKSLVNDLLIAAKTACDSDDSEDETR